MTTYIAEILWADANGRWVGGKGCRFATREEAQAHLDDIRARCSRLMLDSRIAESQLKATHFWQDGFACPRSMRARQKLGL